VNRLEGLGFVVSDAARANYAATRFSLAAMLSGTHLEDLGLDLSKPVDEELVYEAIRQNPTWPLLRRLGYRSVAIPSGWDHVPVREVDTYLSSPVLTEFEVNALRATALGFLAPTVVEGSWVASVRQRTLDGLDSLEALAEDPGTAPFAALVHLPVPHPPFAFQADCSARPLDGDSLGAQGRDDHAGTPATERLVVAQTTCVDRLLGNALEVVATADPDAVVIVFSDHGPEERLDWWSPDPAAVQQRHAMFFAARTPGLTVPFGDAITLVNVLPTLFDTLFDLDLPRRDDRMVFGPIRTDDRLVRVDEP
jgi:hypothetical protein